MARVRQARKCNNNEIAITISEKSGDNIFVLPLALIIHTIHYGI
jgi:hypothetical protein